MNFQRLLYLHLLDFLCDQQPVPARLQIDLVFRFRMANKPIMN